MNIVYREEIWVKYTESCREIQKMRPIQIFNWPLPKVWRYSFLPEFSPVT